MVVYERAMETMQSKLSDSATKESIKYQNLIEEYNKEYLSIIEECGRSLNAYLTQ